MAIISKDLKSSPCARNYEAFRIWDGDTLRSKMGMLRSKDMFHGTRNRCGDVHIHVLLGVGDWLNMLCKNSRRMAGCILKQGGLSKTPLEELSLLNSPSVTLQAWSHRARMRAVCSQDFFGFVDLCFVVDHVGKEGARL